MFLTKRIFYFVLAVIFFSVLGYLVSSSVFEGKLSGYAVVDGQYCGDGTTYTSCSVSKPYFCDAGDLVASCNTCGCPYGYTCDSATGQCSGAGSCEAGGGECRNSCNANEIEFLSLTSTCNIDENMKGQISLQGTKTLYIESTLKNLNSIITLSDISVNAFIEGTQIKDGYTLLSLDPGVDFKQTISLVIPDDVDLSKNYILKVEIAFKDKKISAEYQSVVVGSGFVFVAKDTSITEGKLVSVGQDLAAGIEIVNKKCCIQDTRAINFTRFIDYCSNYNRCSETTKPFYCNTGLLVENCNVCGCQDGYSCGENGRCINSISSQEVKKFFEQTQITPDESPLVGYSVKKFSRVAKEAQEPVVVVAPNVVTVTVADVDLQIQKENVTQKPVISINLNGLL